MAIEEFFDFSTQKDCSGYYTMANQIPKRYSKIQRDKLNLLKFKDTI